MVCIDFKINRIVCILLITLYFLKNIKWLNERLKLINVVQ